MKKLLALYLGLVPCAALAATNKISMVTYFPVPYVAYSQLKAAEQMDIGLTSSCDMKLGCSDSSTTLKAAQVNLTGGRLNLNGGRGIQGDTLSLGSGNNVGQISFQNVRVQTGNMESINAEDIKTSNLNLFGKPFPSCKDANSKGGGQMSWQSLKLKGASSSELYLACGPMDQSSACQPTDSRGATYTEACPSGQTGTGAQYTWDVATCSYKQTKPSSCSSGLKRYLTNYKCTGVDKPLNTEILNNIQNCFDVQSENRYWNNWSAAKYLTDFAQIPSGCSPGKECAACTPGKRYISGNMFPGQTCRKSGMNAPERDRILLVVKYVSCGEHSAPYYPEADATCSRWSDTGGGGSELITPITPGDMVAPNP